MRIGDFVWLDWANVPGLLDYLGLLLGIVGFAIAIGQLVRSRSALVAAEDALNSARSALTSNQLIAVLPAFEEISAQLTAAVQGDIPQQAETALDRFRYRQQEAEALLIGMPSQFHAILPNLRRAGIRVDRAHADLFTNLDQPTAQRVGSALTEVRGIAHEIRTLEVMLRNQLPIAQVGNRSA